MKNILSLLLLLGIIFSYTFSNAQWVQVPCTFYPNTFAANGGYIFAGSDAGVFRSVDGTTWSPFNLGLHGQQQPSPVLSFCSIGSTLLAGADYSEGLFISTNKGSFWTHVADTNAPEAVISFAVHDQFIFAASDRGTVSRSSDNGQTWITIDSGFTTTPNGFNGIAIASDTNFVFFGNNAGQIYRSSNDGDTWDLVFQADHPAIFYAIASHDSTLFAQLQDSILRSTDDGVTWNVVSQHFGGTTFLSYDKYIVDGGYYGVLFSSDNGDSWRTYNDGLPPIAVIDAMLTSGGYLYAGTNLSGISTDGGLWRRPVTDFTSQGVTKLSENDNSVSISPNPTSGTISISDLPKNSQHVTITNMLGETVIKIANPQKSNCQVDLSKLSPGIYYARIISPNSVVMKKIVKE